MLNSTTAHTTTARARLAAFTLAVLLPLAGTAGEVTVSAAASLGNALQEIAPLFESAHPGTVLRLNLGGSGALLAQIAKGAPVDVFISADQETMDQAQAQGLVKPAQRRDLVSNRLVLIVPAGASRVPTTLGDLAQPAYARIAIGLPASVPAGRYARSALESAGLWPAIEPKMIGAQNVRQALDYVARSEVDAGFVYATDAALLSGKVRLAFPVPTPKPIVYPVATLANSPHAAEGDRLVAFLLSPTAQGVWSRHGFGRP